MFKMPGCHTSALVKTLQLGEITATYLHSKYQMFGTMPNVSYIVSLFKSKSKTPYLCLMYYWYPITALLC
jgi:hypothetical protein